MYKGKRNFEKVHISFEEIDTEESVSSIKWYRNVTFELVFGTALVNSYLIYEKNYAASKVTIV